MDEILSDFDSKVGILTNLRISTEQLIRSLLKNEGVVPHQIISRVKKRNSLKNKIIRKNNKYSSLAEITDLVGIRIITYFEDEIDQIAKIISQEFEIDKDNSIDKRILETDKFGYRSLHYVVSYKSERLSLPEYSIFTNLKIEIQIRSILQHCWAEIEHDIGYKGEYEIPNTAKRTFYRVAALLEQADIEFVKLKNELLAYEKNIDNEIKSKPNLVSINKASLISYINNSLLLKGLEEGIVNSRDSLEILPFDLFDSDIVSNKKINTFKSHGYEFINEIDNAYKEFGDEILMEQIKKFKEEEEYIGFVEGASLSWILDKISK